MDIMLVGNGFDLHYEFPTNYINFLNTIKFLTTDYNNSMNTVGAIFSKMCSKEIDTAISKSYRRYREIYDKTPVDHAILSRLCNMAKHNMWFNYLCNSFNKDVGWIDFEKEISFVCFSFQSMFRSDAILSDREKKKLVIGFAKIKSEAVRYILTQQFQFYLEKLTPYYSQFYSGYVQQDETITTKQRDVKQEYCLRYPVGSNNIILNEEKIVSDIFAALEELAEMLRLYLESFIDSVCRKLAECNMLEPLGLSIDKVITFNYTKTYENLVKNTEVIHIHGCTDSKVVLGINTNQDDFADSVDTTFIMFKKYYQRIFYRTDLTYCKFIAKLKMPSIEQMNDYIDLYVMGHSLDITDSDVIKEMFSISNTITILCHNSNVIGNYVANLINIFGKEQFDDLRLNKHLRFRLINTEMDDIISEQNSHKEQLCKAQTLINKTYSY